MAAAAATTINITGTMPALSAWDAELYRLCNEREREREAPGPQFRSFKKAIENPNEKPIEIAAAAAVAPRRWRYFQTEFRSVFQSVF